MVTASFIDRLSQAVDQIENRLKQNHPWKVSTSSYGLYSIRGLGTATKKLVYKTLHGE